MNKNKLLIVSLLATFTMVGCNVNPPQSSSHTGSSNSSTGSTSLGSSTSSSSSLSSTSGPSIDNRDPMEVFEEALEKDYSNMTVGVTQSYFDGESSEYQIEYYYNGYTIVYETYLAEMGSDDPYLYYHDYEGDNYLYFSPDENNPEGAWLNKGYKDADLSIENTYFSFTQLLDNLELEDVEYADGLYFVEDASALENLNQTLFGFAWYNNPESVIFLLSETGELSKIFAFDDLSDDRNYVAIEFLNIGSTTFTGELPPKPTEENVKEYWEYNGEDGPYVDKYIESLSLAILDEEYEQETGFDVVLDIEKTVEIGSSFLPLDANKKDITWHTTDESVLSFDYSWTTGARVVKGLKAGEAEVYATAEGANGETVTSNRIKVKVKPLQEQNKEGCIYDLTFTALVDGVLSATNKVDNNKPYTITSHQSKVSLIDGKNSSAIWQEGENAVVMNPCVMDKDNASAAFVEFNFDTQQVSMISFYYGMFYSNGISNLSKINELKILTSNDGESWNEIDILDEVKENISYENKKLLEKSFEPSSFVKIQMDSNMIGSSMSFAFDSVSFNANSSCNDYIDPSEVIPISEIIISTTHEAANQSTLSLKEGQSATFGALINPSNATNKELLWHSSNTEVASIDNQGNLLALKEGTTEVYATSLDGSVESNRFTITVLPKTKLPNEYLGVWKGETDSYKEATLEFVDESKAVVTIESEVFNLELEDLEDGYYKFVDGDNYLFVKLAFGSDDVLDINGVLGEHGINRYTSTITFSRYIAATELTLTARKSSLIVGESTYITVTATPSNATNINSEDLIWQSSDESVATVENGYINTLSAGEVTITAYTDNGVYGEVTIDVIDKVYPTEIELSASKTEIEIDEKVTIEASLIGENINQTDVKWESSDSKIASVNSSGVVTGKASGKVTITCTAGNNVIATIEITVVGATSKVPQDLIGTTWVGTDDYESTDYYITFNADDTIYVSYYDGAFELEMELESYDGNTFTFIESMTDSTLTITYEDGKLTVDYMYEGVLGSETNGLEYTQS